jgi:hypothetical protein
VRKSFNRLKSLINCNAVSNDAIRFVTMTYAENMTDNRRLKKDLENFHSRLKSHLGKSYEYIYVKEKQERGAWHIHLFLFFRGKAPYLPNALIADCWKRGFVNVQAIKDDINNVGNYLVAYLTTHKDGVKLERLKNYDSGVKLYNCSRGVKRPQTEDIDLVGLCDLLNDTELKIVSDRSYIGCRQFSGGRRVFRNDRYLLFVRMNEGDDHSVCG